MPIIYDTPTWDDMALSQDEAEYPELWPDKGAWSPSLSPLRGSVLHDSIGGKHGTLTNMTIATSWLMFENRWQLAYPLSGSTYVATTSNPLSAVSSFTLVVWLRRGAAGYAMNLGQEDATTTRTGITILSGVCYLVVANGVNTYGSFNSNDTLLHQIIMVYNGGGTGDAGRLQGYLDGKSMALTYGTAIPATTHNTVDTFDIGRLAAVYSAGWFGETLIARRPWSAGDAALSYSLGEGGWATRRRSSWRYPAILAAGSAQNNAPFWLTMMS